jgi:hypothetical protein
VFDQDEVDRVERLSEADRKELRQRLDAVDRRGEKEEARAKGVQFTNVPWPDQASPGRQYAGPHFRLVSNANETLVRRVVVRMEDIFQAYVDGLGVRRQPTELTRIVLYRTVEEYQKWQREHGLAILNPAYYDPKRNEIVAASDLERLGVELDRLRQGHQAKLQELDQYEQRLRKHFSGQPPAALRSQVRELRRQLSLVNGENEAKYDHLRGAFFATLFHEAFHAYLDNYVYPAGTAAVPRWLNEGLAQIFETAIVDPGELRVGHVDPKRLAAVQEAVKQGRFLPLRDLLTADAGKFGVAHASEAQRADRYFLASWALAYYLRFDRKPSGAAIDRYVQIDAQERDKLLAFRNLVDEPLETFERRFHEFLLSLRPDGRVRPAAEPKERPGR